MLIITAVRERKKRGDTMDPEETTERKERGPQKKNPPRNPPKKRKNKKKPKRRPVLVASLLHSEKRGLRVTCSQFHLTFLEERCS